MNIKIPSSKYVIAVSGGVDSMVLLDILAKQTKRSKPIAQDQNSLQLVVAHFNHGIRPQAAIDEEFVRQRAEQLKLPYEAGYGRLGAGASEEAARRGRYGFLNRIKVKHDALAVITAHHQDDMIETAFINMIRGTGRKGLVAISKNQAIIRPLLGWSKSEVLGYAAEHKLAWREDESNTDTDYLRNYIRLNVMPKLNAKKRRQIIDNLDKVAEIDLAIDSLADDLSKDIYNGLVIDRTRFSSLPVAVADELLTRWLRQLGSADFDKTAITRLNTALRTAKARTCHPVKRGLYVNIKKSSASFHLTP